MLNYAHNMLLDLSHYIYQSEQEYMFSQSKKKFARLRTDSNQKLPSLTFSAKKISTLKTEIQNSQEYRLQKVLSKKLLKSRLSPTKYYQSRIEVSAECWSAYNLKQEKYKRGWKPNKIVQFNGLIKLIIVKVFLDLAAEYKELNWIQVKINAKLIRQEKVKQKCEKRSLQQLRWNQRQSNRGLFHNTIISLKDMVFGNILCSYQDLFEYCIIYIGYLIGVINQKSNLIGIDLIHVDTTQKAQKCINNFVQNTNQSLNQQFKSSHSSITQNFDFTSSSHQLSLIFASVYKYQQFKILMDKKQISASIRFQVGFNYYEDRIIKFINQRPNYGGLRIILNFRGANNFGIISYNKSTSLVVVLHDSKFNMADTDIKRVENLIQQLTKPIKTNHSNQTKKLPFLNLANQ